METVLDSAFPPRVLLLASEECEAHVYGEKLLGRIFTSKSGPLCIAPLSDLPAEPEHDSAADIDLLVNRVHQRNKASNSTAEPSGFLNDVVIDVVRQTLRPQAAQEFETLGHPVACILCVSSKHPSPIGALTQLYQQSYADMPPHVGADVLRCVWYLDEDSETGKEAVQGSEVAQDFAAVQSQFGPHCFRWRCGGLAEVVACTAETSVYPYMEKLLQDWQGAGQSRLGSSSGRNRSSSGSGGSGGSSGFGIGRFLKRLVHSGPQRPDFNVFLESARAMQPHVASIPAPRKMAAGQQLTPGFAVNMQLRRLADIAFMLRDFRLALSAYEALRKPFLNEQCWAELGASCEMAAVCSAILRAGDISTQVDTALYTYNARVHLPGHFLRCILLVSQCLVANGDQLLAAGLLSNALTEVDPVFGSGSCPAEAAMLMQQIAAAFESRKWQRKARLWNMLADIEWKRANDSGEGLADEGLADEGVPAS